MKLAIYCTCQVDGVIQRVGAIKDGKEVVRLSRKEVMIAIIDGDDVFTYDLVNKQRGADVILTPNGEFITTDPNDTTRDNLDSLSACSFC